MIPTLPLIPANAETQITGRCEVRVGASAPVSASVGLYDLRPAIRRDERHIESGVR